MSAPSGPYWRTTRHGKPTASRKRNERLSDLQHLLRYLYWGSHRNVGRILDSPAAGAPAPHRVKSHAAADHLRSKEQPQKVNTSKSGVLMSVQGSQNPTKFRDEWDESAGQSKQ